MAKKIDPKAKAKRQKIYAAIGGVLLLGLLAFQVPRTLKMLNPPAADSSSSTPAATTTATSPIAAPSLGGGNATAAAVTGGDGLSDPDAVPAPESGQLLSFGLFRTKDPFAQQLDSSGPTGPAAPAGGGATAGATGPKGVTGKAGSAKNGTFKPAPSTVKTAPTAAVISVNGSPSAVQVGGTFPSADPVFKLVSLTAKGAKVSIAGGSLSSGAPAVTLVKNKPLTLVNTADGTRYVLRLVSTS